MHIDRINFVEKNRNFQCYIYDIDQPPSSIIGSLTDFFEIWKRKCSVDRLPSRGGLPFEEFLGWHSNMRIIDCGENINSLKKTILIGEKFIYYWGKTTMNELIRSDSPPSAETVEGHNRYLNYIYSCHYGVSIGNSLMDDASSIKVKWIDLPLSRDGKNVSHLLSAIVPANE